MFQLIIKSYKIVLLWGVVLGAVVGGISLIVPHFYSAETQILVISRDRSGLDPFTETKLAERVGENLSQIIQTEDFFHKVTETGQSVDRSRWGNLATGQERQRWRDDIQGEMVYGTNLLKLRVYAKEPEGARALAAAVTETLIARGWEYVGSNVSLKVVNSPLVSRWPARPNPLVNAAGGLALGAGLAVVWVIRYKRQSLLSLA